MLLLLRTAQVEIWRIYGGPFTVLRFLGLLLGAPTVIAVDALKKSVRFFTRIC